MAENLNERNPDAVRIEELKINQFTPRCPYFGWNSQVTFIFKNDFGIDTENWQDTMRIQLEEWSSLGLVMPTGAPQKHFGSIPDKTNETDANKATVGVSVGSQLQPNEDLTDEFLVDFNTLSEEQKNFVTKIEENVELLSESSEPIIKCILLEGLAGTGKMQTLGCLRNIHNSNILYVARGNDLCTSVKKKLNLQTSTFCRFIMTVLNMSFESAKKLIKDTDYVLPSPMLEHHFSSLNPRSFRRLLQSTGFSPSVNIIILDEFSMSSPGTLACFVALIKTASTVLREKIIIIFCGDFMHIPPVLTASIDYGPLKDLCELTFPFMTQHRIVHENYLTTVNKLCLEPLINKDEFLEELKNVIPENAFSSEVNYVYPFEDIKEAYTKLRKSSGWYTWLNDVKPEFFSRILAVSAFTYSNREMHYSNLGLAFSIVSQLMARNISIDDIKKYICFTAFTELKSMESGKSKSMDSKTPNDCTILPFLPLIRFFPYRLLELGPTNFNISRKSLVYLIHWILEKGYVIVYCPEIQKFLNIPCGSFTKNSISADLYGIPLEMAFATTFHLVQGQTLTKDVIIALNGVDHRELFAILTRIRNPSQIKNIYADTNDVTEEESE